jgi:mono/diheme cytochrome c family protein
MRWTSLFAGVVGGVLFTAGTCAADNIELPPGPNRSLVYGQCRTCHDLQYLKESAGIPRNAWADILVSMTQYGLAATPAQKAKILDYLGTYLGPNPPKPSAETTKEAALKAEAPVDGSSVFKAQCIGCHQANGQGNENFPPLAGNTDLFLSPTFPATVVLHGMAGQVTVENKKFNGVMPSFSFLSDQEIAAAINYVRSAWGNDAHAPAGAKKITAKDVAAVRKTAMSSAEVHAQRAELKK